MTKAHETLKTILPVAGWTDDHSGDVSFNGATDPVLPTPFRIGLAGSTTVAAAALAAARLWELRSGRLRRRCAAALT